MLRTMQAQGREPDDRGRLSPFGLQGTRAFDNREPCIPFTRHVPSVRAKIYATLLRLIVVRLMTPHRILAIVCCIVTGLAPAVAASAQTFKAAAADAARRFGTSEGHAYAMTFVRDVLKATYDASQACKQSPRDAMHDIVFIVSSSGRIERVVAGGKTAYGRCLSDSMHLPERVSPPPAITGLFSFASSTAHGRSEVPILRSSSCLFQACSMRADSRWTAKC